MTHNQDQCAMCFNSDICKYKDEYQKLLWDIKENKHAIFERNLSCRKFVDSREKVIDGWEK